MTLRHLALRHRHWAALLLLAALAVKLLVPAGYMPTGAGRTMTIAMCTGSGPATVTVALPGAPGEDGNGPHHGANHHPCAFSALGGPALAATDPALLAAALAFAIIFALLARAQPALRRETYLRPPLRGPPLHA